MTSNAISLNSERLTFRPWNADDADVLLEMRANPELSKWLGSPKPWTDLDQARREIAIWNRRNDADDPFGTWAITTSAELARTRSVRSDYENEVGSSTGSVDNKGIVGSVNLSTIRFGNEIEVGWYLHPDATGHGYATEAARTVIDHGLSNGVRRIWALMWRDNVASAKVARAAGMRDLGVLVDPWYGGDDGSYSQMFLTD